MSINWIKKAVIEESLNNRETLITNLTYLRSI